MGVRVLLVRKLVALMVIAALLSMGLVTSGTAAGSKTTVVAQGMKWASPSFTRASFAYHPETDAELAVNQPQLVSATKNLLSNPGFDQGITDWTYAKTTGGRFALDQTVGRTMQPSLHGTVGVTGDQLAWGTTGNSITPGKTYIMSGYVKTKDVSPGNIVIQTDWLTATGALGGQNVVESQGVGGTSDWTRIWAVAAAPGTATKAVLRVRPKVRDGQGEFWVDDLQIEEATAQDSTGAWAPSIWSPVMGKELRIEEAAPIADQSFYFSQNLSHWYTSRQEGLGSFTPYVEGTATRINVDSYGPFQYGIFSRHTVSGFQSIRFSVSYWNHAGLTPRVKVNFLNSAGQLISSANYDLPSSSNLTSYTSPRIFLPSGADYLDVHFLAAYPLNSYQQGTVWFTNLDLKKKGPAGQKELVDLALSQNVNRDFTALGWFRPTWAASSRTTSNGTLFKFPVDANNFVEAALIPISGGQQFRYRKTIASVAYDVSTGTVTFNSGDLVKFAVRQSASGMVAFIRPTGTSATVTATGSNAAWLPVSPNVVEIGRSGDANFANGSFDNLQIYNRALSDSEVESWFNRSDAPSNKDSGSISALTFDNFGVKEIVYSTASTDTSGWTSLEKIGIYGTSLTDNNARFLFSTDGFKTLKSFKGGAWQAFTGGNPDDFQKKASEWFERGMTRTEATALKAEQLALLKESGKLDVVAVLGPAAYEQVVLKQVSFDVTTSVPVYIKGRKSYNSSLWKSISRIFATLIQPEPAETRFFLSQDGGVTLKVYKNGALSTVAGGTDPFPQGMTRDELEGLTSAQLQSFLPSATFDVVSIQKTGGGEGKTAPTFTRSSTAYKKDGTQVAAGLPRYESLYTNDDPTSTMLSQSGLTGFSAAACVNDEIATGAWHTDTSVAGSWLQVDLGAGNPKAYGKVRIYSVGPGYAGVYDVEYSDDGLSWLKAATGFAPSATGWNEKTWGNVGAHRFWRLLLTNTPGAGPWLTEIEFYRSPFGSGIMVEEGTTNVWLNSEAVDLWLRANSSVTANAVAGPFGGNNADRVNFGGITNDWDIVYQGTFTGTYTWSAWLKTADGSSKTVYVTWGAPDAAKRVTLTVDGTWRRYTALVTPSGENVHLGNHQFHTPAGWSAFSLDVWGAQLEQKAYATSYMATTSASVTRSAETLTISTAGVLDPAQGTAEFWWNPQKPISGFTNSSVSSKLLQIGSYYSNASLTLWAFRYTSDPVGSEPHLNLVIKGQSNTGWSQSVTVKPSGSGWYKQNEYHHFAVSWSGGNNFKVYMDGALVGGPYTINDPVTSWAGGIAYFPGEEMAANGLVDDLRISSIARSDAEILAAYQSNAPVPVDPYTTYKASFDGNLNAEGALAVSASQTYDARVTVDAQQKQVQAAAVSLSVYLSDGEVLTFNNMSQASAESFLDWIEARQKNRGPVYYLFPITTAPRVNTWLNYYLIKRFQINE